MDNSTASDPLAEKRRKQAEYMREWTRKNADRVNAQRKARYRATHPLVIREPFDKQAWDRAYREANRESLSVERKARYRADPEPAKARARAYAAANPDKVKAYRDANRGRRNAQANEWHVANVDHARAYAAEYYAANRERILASAKAYYLAHPEDQRRKSQEWRDAHPDKLREQGLRYRTANAPIVHDKNAKRRARLKGARIETVDRRVVHRQAGGLCGICHLPVAFKAMTLDHIQPLIAGGAHSYANIQPAHRSCNSRKGGRI